MAAENLADAIGTVKIGLDDFIPLGFRNIEKRSALGAARGVHQNIYFAKFGHRGVEQRLH